MQRYLSDSVDLAQDSPKQSLPGPVLARSAPKRKIPETVSPDQGPPVKRPHVIPNPVLHPRPILPRMLVSNFEAFPQPMFSAFQPMNNTFTSFADHPLLRMSHSGIHTRWFSIAQQWFIDSAPVSRTESFRCSPSCSGFSSPWEFPPPRNMEPIFSNTNALCDLATDSSTVLPSTIHAHMMGLGYEPKGQRGYQYFTSTILLPCWGSKLSKCVRPCFRRRLKVSEWKMDGRFLFPKCHLKSVCWTHNVPRCWTLLLHFASKSCSW